MELDELVTKIINHIDETAAKTKNEMTVLIEESATKTKNEMTVLIEKTAAQTKNEMIVLMEQQRSEFNTFGEGLDDLRNQVSEIKNEVGSIKTELSDFRIETRLKFKENEENHQQLKQMIRDLAIEQKDAKTKLNDRIRNLKVKSEG